MYSVSFGKDDNFMIDIEFNLVLFFQYINLKWVLVQFYYILLCYII